MNRRTWLLAAFGSLVAAAALLGRRGPRPPPFVPRSAKDPLRHPWVLDQLLLDDPAPLGIFPDGASVLLLSARDERFSLIERPLAGAEPRVLDVAAAPQHRVTFKPDGSAIAFTSDRLETEGFDLFVLEVASRTRTWILGSDREGVGTLQWSPSGELLAFTSRAPEGDRQLVVVDPVRRTRRTLLRPVSRHAGLAWSPDGLRIATGDAEDPGALDLLPLSGGPGSRVVALPGGLVQSIAWSPDGAALALAALAADASYAALYVLDLVGLRTTRLSAPQGDVGGPRFSPGGDRLIYRLSANGEAFLRTIHLDGTLETALGPQEGSVSMTRFAPDGKTAFALSTGRAEPKLALLLDLATGAGAAPFRGAQPAASLGIAAERHDLLSPDGLASQAYVWRAPRLPGRPPAAAVFVHGGPRSQWPRQWSNPIDVLLRAGIDVVMPNYRGSSGYGREFESRHGQEGEVDDVMGAVDFSREKLGADPSRTILVGFSYGTQLSLEAAARSPEKVGSLMLLGVTTGRPRPVTPPARMPRCVIYHGAFDPLPPKDAQAALRGWFAPAAAADVHFHVLDGEPHSFIHPSSWAQVYDDLISLVGAARQP